MEYTPDISEMLPALISAERKRMHKDLSEFLQPFSISGFHAMFLKRLLHGPSTLRALSLSMGVNPASTTRAVAHLKTLGYISEEKEWENQKKYEIRITESGGQLAHKIKERIKNNFNSRLSALTESEREQFIYLLKKLSSTKPSAGE